MSLPEAIFTSPFSRRSFMDKTLECRDCGKAFLSSVAEQEESAGRGHFHAPSRCPECRATRRQRRSDAAQAPMGNGGPPTPYGGGGRQRREMHTAVCAECGSQAQVPFVPRNDRPVYCSNCFEKVRVAR